MKQFLKALDKKSNCFSYLIHIFSHLSEGVFVGPDIRWLITSGKLKNKMNSIDKNACVSFTDVTQRFLRNKKDSNYTMVVELRNFKELSCNMRLKYPFCTLILNIS